MARMRDAPPRVVLLEGGDAPSRLAMSEHWARLHNCLSGTACGDCAPCRQIVERTDPEQPWERAFRDFRLFDGSLSNIKVDWIRRIKPLFAEPPRGEGLRVVVFHEAQQLTTGAANALLKAFEEPNPGTLFVLNDAPARAPTAHPGLAFLGAHPGLARGWGGGRRVGPGGPGVAAPPGRFLGHGSGLVPAHRGQGQGGQGPGPVRGPGLPARTGAGHDRARRGPRPGAGPRTWTPMASDAWT